jgi:predicted phage tail protein
MNTRTLITFFTLSCLLLAFATQAQGGMAQMVSKQAKKPSITKSLNGDTTSTKIRS